METQLRKFSDYRAFLLHSFEKKKLKNKNWSYGAWAKSLGLKSTSSLTKIVKNERHPGAEMVKKFTHYFEFNESDLEYFLDLIQLQKIKKDPRLGLLLMEKLKKSNPDTHFVLGDNHSYEILSNWYTLSIREMVDLDEFFEDPSWIQSNFQSHVNVGDIKRALEILEENELLIRDSSGKLKLNNGRLSTEDDMANIAIKKYHRDMLDGAKEALFDFSVDFREFQSVLIKMNKEDIPVAKKLIRGFLDDFSKALDQKGKQKLFQLGIQLFPISKQKNEEIQ
ncbi:MAG: TIGR02147 family protein [Bacteriovoracaceae bacterium]|jgi:uncharacterized protein (TIGR02147 family)|nr:TIGR02147 family protein [Bacteriovoracaceae bacterium]